jgi:hypothetical protein
MEVILEIVLEVIIIWIFRYPGASIRWLFLQKKRSFKSILDEEPYLNAILSISLLAIIIFLARYLYGQIK